MDIENYLADQYVRRYSKFQNFIFPIFFNSDIKLVFLSPRSGASRSYYFPVTSSLTIFLKFCHPFLVNSLKFLENSLKFLDSRALKLLFSLKSKVLRLLFSLNLTVTLSLKIPWKFFENFLKISWKFLENFLKIT